VSITLLTCVAMLGVYAAASMLFSSLASLSWRAGLSQALSRSGSLLILRLLPGAGAALLVLCVVLPAFLAYEPAHESEGGGPLLWFLSAFSVVALGDGIRRGWSAWKSARKLLQSFDVVAEQWTAEGHRVEIVDAPEPIVAVVGGWRPRIIAAKRVLAACSEAEFRLVIAHEVAHLSARDNLKCLLLVACPDPLAWLPMGATLLRRWKTAVEFEADERAAGSDPYRRVALASALTKVARLAIGNYDARPLLSLSIASDDIAGRVRQLIAPPQTRSRSAVRAIAILGLLLPLAALPLHSRVHHVIEILVAFGR
jgi:Zn-dependent protease with chaperone function